MDNHIELSVQFLRELRCQKGMARDVRLVESAILWRCRDLKSIFVYIFFDCLIVHLFFFPNCIVILWHSNDFIERQRKERRRERHRRSYARLQSPNLQRRRKRTNYPTSMFLSWLALLIEFFFHPQENWCLLLLLCLEVNLILFHFCLWLKKSFSFKVILN